MRQSLERRLDGMDEWKDALLGALSAHGPERLGFRPGGQGWCVLDVVQHLALVEEGVVAYARKKVQAPVQPVPFLGRARLLLLAGVMRSPIRVRAPIPQVVPAETLPLDESSARWEEARGALRDLLVSLPEERRRAFVFRHPVAGPLDAAGTLTFVDEHAKHHDAQIRRIWRAPGCPG